jgi:hypothetical protein
VQGGWCKEGTIQRKHPDRKKISFITGISFKFVKEYIEIGKENDYFLDKKLKIIIMGILNRNYMGLLFLLQYAGG